MSTPPIVRQMRHDVWATSMLLETKSRCQEM